MGLHGRAIAAGLALGAAVCALAPATAPAAGLVAAHDRYVTGKGFEIGLVNALTGATLALPAGVNTNDDELHPTLTPDGRYLVFMRTKLLPKLNGDIVPPEARTLFVADRETGTVTSLNRTGAGAVFSGAGTLGWGVRPFERPQQQGRPRVSFSSPFTAGAAPGGVEEHGSPPTNGLVETVHADHGSIREFNFFINQPQDFSARYLSYAVLNSTTGALLSQTVQFTTKRDNQQGFGSDGQTEDHGSATAPAGHPDVRSDDYVAFHMGGDIQTISFPTDDLAPAPEPITSSAPERDPAWSPNGLNLGFIRTSGGLRRLGVFNATPGIQTILNPLASLGPEAPTPQTRAYQEVWGGLSTRRGAPSSAPVMTAATPPAARSCRAPARRHASSRRRLSIGSRSGSSSRAWSASASCSAAPPRGCARSARCRSAPRSAGATASAGTARSNGKRLRPGTYLLTYRSLQRQEDHEHVGLDPLDGRQGRQDPPRAARARPR